MFKYILKLFVVDKDDLSILAISNVKAFCEKNMKNNYELTIIDIDKQIELAQKNRILAIPTLIKEEPSPEQRFIGNLSDTENLFRLFRL
ncbi:KaiB domain protein [Candidatus Magnetomorum sp. HK-1]|nr:KaiB domain protein [Candidatus Magnetomorum sp. HK-1]